MIRPCARPLHRDEVPVPVPCAARWEEMVGDAKVRHCAPCDQRVHDLSAMTAREARFLLAREAAPCVRYATRVDGSVVHRRDSRRARAAAFVVALAAAAPAYASGAPIAELDVPTSLAELRDRVVSWLRAPAPEPPPVETIAGGLRPAPEPPAQMGRFAPAAPPEADARPEPARHAAPRTLPELEVGR